jgi:hypothetical protein
MALIKDSTQPPTSLAKFVAEKDAEIARLNRELEKANLDCVRGILDGTLQPTLAEPRKVTDAQREAIREYMHHYIAPGIAAEEAIKYICAVFESTDEPAAK